MGGSDWPIIIITLFHLGKKILEGTVAKRWDFPLEFPHHSTLPMSNKGKGESNTLLFPKAQLSQAVPRLFLGSSHGSGKPSKLPMANSLQAHITELRCDRTCPYPIFIASCHSQPALTFGLITQNLLFKQDSSLIPPLPGRNTAQSCDRLVEQPFGCTLLKGEIMLEAKVRQTFA